MICVKWTRIASAAAKVAAAPANIATARAVGCAPGRLDLRQATGNPGSYD